MDAMNGVSTYISAASAVGVVGSTVFFYKKTNDLQDQIDEIEQSTKKVETIATELTKKVLSGSNGDSDKTLKHINKVKKEIKVLQSDIEDKSILLDSIMKALSEQGIKVELPRKSQVKKSQPKKKVSSKKSKKKKYESSDEDESDSSDERSDESDSSDDDVAKAISKIRRS